MKNLFFIYLCLLVFSQNTYAISSPHQTGQQNTVTIGDDGDLKFGTVWPSPRFTDNQDGTLTDNLTGLMWIKDAFCASNYISGAASVNWHDSVTFASTLNDHSLSTPCQEYTKNYEDWRAPNLNELSSLIRAGLENDTQISDSLYIPNDKSGAFLDIGIVSNPIWTSTTVAENPEQAWIINLKTGEISKSEKIRTTDLAFIFSAVRSTSTISYFATGQSTKHIDNDDGDLEKGIPLPTPRFVKTELGTVIDKLTGLMWLEDANCANPNGSDWSTANNSVLQSRFTLITPFVDNCPAYTPTVVEDEPETWRFPNMNELRSLVDYGENNPALDTNHPFSIVTDKAFWTSTSSNNTPQTSAWTLSLETGKIFPATEKNENAYTWPVRGPIDFPDISISHKTLQFNSLFINSENSDQTITITNIGSLDLDIGFIRLTDENNLSLDNHFSIGRDLCSERPLTKDTSCSIVINFAPEKTGDLKATIKIESNALGISELSIPVTGTGLASTSTEKSNSRCFIATAAYGSYLEPEVKALRTFRDEVLLQHDWGIYLVKRYYESSPPLANYLAQHDSLRTLTRALLTPMVFSIKYPGMLLIALLLSLTFRLIRIKKLRLKYQ